MPVELQSKLLRFLQDRRFTPLGGTRVVEADVRIVAATSRDGAGQGAHVQEAVLGRLGAQPIVLPPLRDRIEDVGRLAAHFLGDPERAFEPEAFHAMCLHAWPLNVRELSKVINEAKALSLGVPAIGLEHLPDAVTATLQLDAEEDAEDTHVDPTPPPRVRRSSADARRGAGRAPAAARAVARRSSRRCCPLCRGSVAEVARRLNRQYAVVWRNIQRYGIDASEYRDSNGQPLPSAARVCGYFSVVCCRARHRHE